jgi:hypothetical protein
MAQTPPNVLDVAPTAPDRADRVTFAARAEAFTNWMKTVAAQMQTLATGMYNNAVDAFNSATNSAISANASAASAAAAQALTGAVAFNSGTTYTLYQAAISTVNLLTYRRKTAGSSATDPSADSTNWVNTGLPPVVVVRTGVNTTMLPGVYYVITAAGITMTLPASPGSQDLFHYRSAVSIGGSSWTLAPGGTNKIEGSTSNFNVNVQNARGTLWFDGTDGYIHLTT